MSWTSCFEAMDADKNRDCNCQDSGLACLLSPSDSTVEMRYSIRSVGRNVLLL
jgi:hypothetical protein